MSLQNLAHVCSHLQNTSRARLAKTSVKLTKLHLSVALSLQKQGFISSVEIGGESPPQPPKDTILPRNADILSYGQYKDIVAAIRRSSIAQVRRAEPWSWYPAVDSDATPATDTRDAVTLESNSSHASKQAKDVYDNAFLSESDYQLRPWMLHFEDTRPFKLEQAIQNPALIPQHPSVSLLSYEAWTTHSNSLAHGNQTYLPDTLATEPWRCYPDPAPYFHQPSIRTTPDPWLQIPDNPAERRLWLGLKYWRNEPVISRCSVVSKGSRRVNMKLDEIAKIVRGETARSSKGVIVPGLRLIGECMFFKTDLGMLEARECVEKHRGGLALCRVS